eukprot:2123870-Pleurochrysis_carterae.AAC.1
MRVVFTYVQCSHARTRTRNVHVDSGKGALVEIRLKKVPPPTSTSFRYMSTVAMRWPPLAQKARPASVWGSTPSKCSTYLCPSVYRATCGSSMWPNGLLVSKWIFSSIIGHGDTFFDKWHVRLVLPLVASLPVQSTQSKHATRRE